MNIGRKRKYSEMNSECESEMNLENEFYATICRLVFSINTIVGGIAEYLNFKELIQFSNTSRSIAQSLMNNNIVSAEFVIQLIEEYRDSSLTLKTWPFWRNYISNHVHMLCGNRLQGNNMCHHRRCFNIEHYLFRNELLAREVVTVPECGPFRQTMLCFNDSRWQDMEYIFGNTASVHHGKILAAYNAPYYVGKLYSFLANNCEIIKTYQLSNSELQMFDVCCIENVNDKWSINKVFEDKTFHQPLRPSYPSLMAALCGRFKWQHWNYAIDWNHFFIAGGSILTNFFPDIGIDKSSDIDIFCYNWSWPKFKRAFWRFIKRLVSDGARLAVFETCSNVYNVKIEGLDLSYRHLITPNGGPLEPFTIQFIWTCKNATPESILSCFDLSCCQIGFQPGPLHCGISYTYAFAHFANTGIARSFHIDTSEPAEKHLNRILKYANRGIKYWWFNKEDNACYLLNRRREQLAPGGYEENAVATNVERNAVLYYSEFKKIFKS